MALSSTARGTGGNNTTATTLTIVPGSSFSASGSHIWGVLAIAADNAGSGGATTVFPATLTDSVGNTWTRRQQGVYDPGAVSAGVDIAIYTAPITTTLTTADNIPITWAGGVSVIAKAWALWQVTAGAGNSIQYVTGGLGTGAASAAPTVTTSSIPSGDMVIGWGGAESANTWTGDADATNGSWSAQQAAGFGTTTNGMSVTSQTKVVTATATQTYNPTLTSADQRLGWIQLDEVLGPKVTSTAEVSLASVDTPATRTAHTITVRARVTSGAGTAHMRVALYEGATNRSGDLDTTALTTSLASYTVSIPDANAANITDYSNLGIRFLGRDPAGGALVFEVDQIYLELPVAAEYRSSRVFVGASQAAQRSSRW